jgi:hypothetical protein
MQHPRGNTGSPAGFCQLEPLVGHGDSTDLVVGEELVASGMSWPHPAGKGQSGAYPARRWHGTENGQPYSD